MSATHNLPFTRFTRQVRTEPQALLATDVAAANALELLKTEPWTERSSGASVTFPARNAVQDGFNPLWDAFKHIGNYASGYQRAYAGAVAYRFQVPAAALTGPTDITSIALPIYVDRWLVDGIRVAAYLSDDAAPPDDWATIREGDIHDDAVLPMTYTDPGGDRIVIEKNGTTTLTWPALTDSKKYVYVMLTLEDYTTTRGFWIEGASLLRGDAAVTTFAASVTEDSPDDLFLGQFSVVPPDNAGFMTQTQMYTTQLFTGVAPAGVYGNRVRLETSLVSMDYKSAESEILGWSYGLRFDASGSNTNARVIRRISASWYRPPTNKTLTKLRFRGNASVGNLISRILVYFIPGYLIPDDGSTRVGYDATDFSVAATAAERRVFWTGQATSVPFWDTDGAVSAGTKPCVCLLDYIMLQPISESTLFDINQQVTAEGTILVALTPHSLVGLLEGTTGLSTLDYVELV